MDQLPNHCKKIIWYDAPAGIHISTACGNAMYHWHTMGGFPVYFQFCGVLMKVEKVTSTSVPGLPPDRALVVVRKHEPTPERYPRRAGVPQRRLLGRS